MAQTTTEYVAGLEGWEDITEDWMRDAFLGATQDVCELMTIGAEGVSKGGTRRVGFVPVAEGELINSFEVRIDGASIGTGPSAVDLIVAQGSLDSPMEGAFTAPYARRMEYGFTGTDSLGREYNQPGWFFVTTAAESWEEALIANAEYTDKGRA